MLNLVASIRCEIAAPTEAVRRDLERIAQTCAIDTGLTVPLVLLDGGIRDGDKDTKIHFRVPNDIAITHDAIWNLACRVACFCPNARISTQIDSAYPRS